MEKREFSPQMQTSLLLLLIFAGLYLVAGILMSLALTLIVSPAELEAFELSNPKIGVTIFVSSQLGMFLMAFVVYLKIVNVKFKDALDYQKFNFKYLLFIILGFVPMVFIVNGLTMFNHWIIQQFPASGMIERQIEREELYTGLFNSANSSLFPIFLLASSILPALVEELVFRGLLFKKLALVSNGKIHFAIWTSATIFAALHTQPWNLIPMIAMGGLFGYIYHHTKDIRYSIILHALFNAATLTVMVFFPETTIS
jgi:CAAX protease family protein